MDEQKKKHQFVALKKHVGCVTVNEIEVKMKLPDGCTGLLFCFESKKAARKYWGKDVDLINIELKKDKLE